MRTATTTRASKPGWLDEPVAARRDGLAPEAAVTAALPEVTEAEAGVALADAAVAQADVVDAGLTEAEAEADPEAEAEAESEAEPEAGPQAEATGAEGPAVSRSSATAGA